MQRHRDQAIRWPPRHAGGRAPRLDGAACPPTRNRASRRRTVRIETPKGCRLRGGPSRRNDAGDDRLSIVNGKARPMMQVVRPSGA
jgi:hypothetical protein